VDGRTSQQLSDLDRDQESALSLIPQE
jgi:hypothetical protein